MKDTMINILFTVGGLAAVSAILLFTPIKHEAKFEQAQIASNVVGDFAEVYAIDSKSDYILCGVDAVADSEFILVSEDLGKCGEGMTIRFVDGSVISGQIAGILRKTPNKTVQVYNLDTPQVTQIFKHN